MIYFLFLTGYGQVLINPITHMGHPDYNAGTTNYDFAIVRLSQPVELGLRAMPACLPDSALGGDALGGETVTVSGWGRTSSGGSQATVLQLVNVPAITNAECRQTGYGESQITDAMLCAGHVDAGGVDSCQGDSGGNIRKYLIII